jgi:hypothetical protein
MKDKPIRESVRRTETPVVDQSISDEIFGPDRWETLDIPNCKTRVENRHTSVDGFTDTLLMDLRSCNYIILKPRTRT